MAGVVENPENKQTAGNLSRRNILRIVCRGMEGNFSCPLKTRTRKLSACRRSQGVQFCAYTSQHFAHELLGRSHTPARAPQRINHPTDTSRTNTFQNQTKAGRHRDRKCVELHRRQRAAPSHRHPTFGNFRDLSVY